MEISFSFDLEDMEIQFSKYYFPAYWLPTLDFQTFRHFKPLISIYSRRSEEHSPREQQVAIRKKSWKILLEIVLYLHNCCDTCSSSEKVQLKFFKFTMRELNGKTWEIQFLLLENSLTLKWKFYKKINFLRLFLLLLLYSIFSIRYTTFLY